MGIAEYHSAVNQACARQKAAGMQKTTRERLAYAIGHAGCKAYRPEKALLGRDDLMSGPAGMILTDALKTYCPMEPCRQTLKKNEGVAWQYPPKAVPMSTGAVSSSSAKDASSQTRKSYVREGGQEVDGGCYNQVAHIMKNLARSNR